MTRLWYFWGLRIPLLFPSSLWNKLRNKTWESESKCQLHYQWSWSRGQGWLVLLSGSLKYLCLDTTADLCLARDRAHLCIRKPIQLSREWFQEREHTRGWATRVGFLLPRSLIRWDTCLSRGMNEDSWSLLPHFCLPRSKKKFHPSMQTWEGGKDISLGKTAIRGNIPLMLLRSSQF